MSEETFTPESSNEPNKNVQKNSKINTSLLVLNIVLLISIGILYVLFFSQKNTKNHSSEANNNIVSEKANILSGDLKIAYVNTDSILVNYNLAKDLEKELNSFRTSQENNYRNKVEKFQKDLQEYLQIGATLTLTEQRNREETFKRRELELGELQDRMLNQIQEKQINENVRLLNAVFAFIRDYNLKNQQFNIILKKSFADSPVMYIDDSMDITQEIIDGLNKEYEDLKNK